MICWNEKRRRTMRKKKIKTMLKGAAGVGIVLGGVRPLK